MARIERNRQLYYTEGNTVRKMAAPLERLEVLERDVSGKRSL